MLMQEKINNAIVPLEQPNIYKINEKNYVKTQLLKKRGSEFYDIVFNNNGKEIFIGRFLKDFSNLKVSYNSGKILIYSDKCNSDGSFDIVKVISLYDILDDTFYSVSEEEALNMFDSNLSTSALKNKYDYICRSDIEKVRRLHL